MGGYNMSDAFKGLKGVKDVGLLAIERTIDAHIVVVANVNAISELELDGYHIRDFRPDEEQALKNSGIDTKGFDFVVEREGGGIKAEDVEGLTVVASGTVKRFGRLASLPGITMPKC